MRFKPWEGCSRRRNLCCHAFDHLRFLSRLPCNDRWAPEVTKKQVVNANPEPEKAEFVALRDLVWCSAELHLRIVSLVSRSFIEEQWQLAMKFVRPETMKVQPLILHYVQDDKPQGVAKEQFSGRSFSCRGD